MVLFGSPWPSNFVFKKDTRMGDNNLKETIRLQRMFADMSETEKQQAKEDLEELQGKTKKVTFKVHATVKSLCLAADKLDEVWKDSRNYD